MRIDKLAATHDRSTFRCGRDELDQWLRTAAMQTRRCNRSARTRVLVAAAVRDVLAAAEHVDIVLMAIDAIDDAAAAFTAHFGSVRLDVDRARPALAARVKELQATFDG